MSPAAKKPKKMNDEEFREYVIEAFEKLDKKVEGLLAFKWQAIGGLAVLTVILNLIR